MSILARAVSSLDNKNRSKHAPAAFSTLEFLDVILVGIVENDLAHFSLAPTPLANVWALS